MVRAFEPADVFEIEINPYNSHQHRVLMTELWGVPGQGLEGTSKLLMPQSCPVWVDGPFLLRYYLRYRLGHLVLLEFTYEVPSVPVP